MNLTQKWHGLPVWAWGGIGVVVLAGGYLFIHRWRQSASSPPATSSPTSSSSGGAVRGYSPPIIVHVPGGDGGGDPTPTPPKGGHSYSTTIDGDTLEKVAFRVYGRPQVWPFILQANQQRLWAAANARRLMYPDTPHVFVGNTPLWAGIVLETDNPTPPGVADTAGAGMVAPAPGPVVAPPTFATDDEGAPVIPAGNPTPAPAWVAA